MILNKIPRWVGSDMNPCILGIFNPSNGMKLSLLFEKISSSKGKKLTNDFEKMAPLWITSTQISDRGGSSGIEKKALFLGSLDVLNAFFCIKNFFVENFEKPIF